MRDAWHLILKLARGRPMGARTQLTFFPEPVHGAYVPNSGAHPVFLFLKVCGYSHCCDSVALTHHGQDTGGNEYYQVYSYDMQSGAVTVLTDGTSRHGSVVWSNAGGGLCAPCTVRRFPLTLHQMSQIDSRTSKPSATRRTGECLCASPSQRAGLGAASSRFATGTCSPRRCHPRLTPPTHPDRRRRAASLRWTGLRMISGY